MPTPFSVHTDQRDVILVTLYGAPVDFGGNRYVLCATSPDVNPSNMAMYKSVDNGATWAEQDNANSPLGPFQSQEVGFYYPGSGPLIYILYADYQNGKLLTLQSFNMTTNLWGPRIGGGPAITNPLATYLVRLSSGEFIGVYNFYNGANTRVTWVSYNGAWGAPNTVPLVAGASTSDGNVSQVALDTTHGIVHFLLNERNAGGAMFHCLINGGVLTGPTDTGLSRDDFDNIYWGNGIYVPSLDAIKFISCGNSPATSVDIHVMTCAPSAAPVFTLETAASPAYNYDVGLSIVLSPDGTRIRAFWAQGNFSSNPPTSQYNIWYAEQAVGRTAWAAPVAFWSWAADPPSPPPSTNDLINPWFTASWSADNIIGIAVELGRFSGPLCTTTYYLGALPTVALVNPGPVGRRAPAPSPNQFDFCLHREFRVFQQIDYERLGCGRLPSCFRMDEREWGGWE